MTDPLKKMSLTEWARRRSFSSSIESRITTTWNSLHWRESSSTFEFFAHAGKNTTSSFFIKKV